MQLNDKYFLKKLFWREIERQSRAKHPCDLPREPLVVTQHLFHHLLSLPSLHSAAFPLSKVASGKIFSQGYLSQCLPDQSEYDPPKNRKASWLLPGGPMLLHTAILPSFSSPDAQVGTEIYQQVYSPPGEQDAHVIWCPTWF